MNKIVGLIVCLAVIQTGYALKCYNCVSSGNDKNCDEFGDPSKFVPVECGKSASASMKPACIKKVIEDKKTNAMNTTRSCVIMRGETTDTECKASNNFNVVSCDVCMDDLCNSSNSMNFNVFAMVGSIVTYVLARYYY